MISLLSVGIDIGTTTTQLVISRLTLENVMPGSYIPRICITDKRVIYVGQVHYTPLTDRQHVDGAVLQELVKKEYTRAGFQPADIDTGAVIITGETAKKENAEEIIHSLAGFAGDFVIATAGPDLESVIAGKGSGAWKTAQKTGSGIINVDIGGGTANIVAFNKERIQSTSCINIGGRLIEIDPLEHKVRYIAPPAQEILLDLNDSLKIGDPVDMKRLMPAVRRMVQVLDQVLLGEGLDPLARRLLMTDTLSGNLDYTGIVFSGGVGRYFYVPHENWFVHGDIGVLLAEALKEARIFQKIKLLPAEETLHATVLGAGAHTVSVSGSTTSIDEGLLPIRNLPVVTLEVAGAERINFWRGVRKRYLEEKRVAYWIPALSKMNFVEIDLLAQDLVVFQDEFQQNPLIVLAQDDIGKVLGQAIRFHNKDLNLICLDEIEIQDGDYIDIAKPLPGQEVVPVIVKTLVFAR